MNRPPGSSGLVMEEPLIFELGAKGRENDILPYSDLSEMGDENIIPDEFCRKDIDGFPEVGEVEVVRHFTRLSLWNYEV
jgi:glycine dehydrogenase subunit 2